VKKPLAFILCIFIPQLFFADAVLLYNAGKKMQDKGEWYSAIEKYQEALVSNSTYAEAYKGLAECFYGLGEYSQALSYVNKAESLRKKNPDLITLRGFILIGLSKIDDAKKDFETVLAALPNNASARFGLAEIELLSGRISSAAAYYSEALSRYPENRKALLSLAILSNETGNVQASRDYIARALKFHGDNPQVFYFASYLSQLQGNTGEAELRARTALSLKPEYNEALALLSTILLNAGRYQEVVELSDRRILLDRNSFGVWYIRALALEKMGKYPEALKSARNGLQIHSDDELLRTLADRLSVLSLALEDPSRKPLAVWHSDKAFSYEQKNLSDQALFEYRRALRIDPYDINARHAYAKLLLNKGLPARYIEQLEFIQSIGKGSVAVNDSVESYRKLLSGSVQEKWSIDPLLIDKTRTGIGLFFVRDMRNIMHPDAERLTASMIAEALGDDQKVSVYASDVPSASYSDAFRRSRESGDAYFGFVSFSETDCDVVVGVELYVSSGGSKAGSFSAYRTGNDRYSHAIRRVSQLIRESIPLRGTILARHQQNAVIDLGKSDGIASGSTFSIISPDKISFKPEGTGLLYNEQAVLGSFVVTGVSDDIAEGVLTRSGFFDRIKKGDIVVPVLPERELGKAADEPQIKAFNPLLQLIRSIL